MKLGSILISLLSFYHRQEENCFDAHKCMIFLFLVSLESISNPFTCVGSNNIWNLKEFGGLTGFGAVLPVLGAVLPGFGCI